MKKNWLGLLLAALMFGTPVYGESARVSLGDRVSLIDAIVKLNREATSDLDLAALIQSEYGTPDDEMKWAAGASLSWGEIAALAYIHATTGRRFADMAQDEARQDFWTYAERAGMSCEKMAHSLGNFLKRAQRERNSRIFERLRASRRVHALPDLGSGFGLFQEALDFRRIDSPRPTKIHTGTGVLAKGEK